MPPKATRQLAASGTEATSVQLQVVADVHQPPREEAAEKQLLVWFKTQRSMFGRLNRTKSGQCASRDTPRQSWNRKNIAFLKTHISVRTKTKQLGKVPCADANIYDEDDEIVESDSSSEATAIVDTENQSSSIIQSKSSYIAKSRSQVDEAILKLVDQASESQNVPASGGRYSWYKQSKNSSYAMDGRRGFKLARPSLEQVSERCL